MKDWLKLAIMWFFVGRARTANADEPKPGCAGGCLKRVIIFLLVCFILCLLAAIGRCGTPMA